MYTSWVLDLGPKLVKLAQNGTIPGLFQIRFQYILARKLKSPGFVPFWDNLTKWGQSDRVVRDWLFIATVDLEDAREQDGNNETSVTCLCYQDWYRV